MDNLYNKAKLIDDMSVALKITKKDAKETLDWLENTILTTAKSGAVVNLGWIKIGVKDVPARTFRNPSTGKQVKKPETKVVWARMPKSVKKDV